MGNTINGSFAGVIQSFAKVTISNPLSDGICLQSAEKDSQITEQAARYDTLELSPDQSQAALDVPDELSIEVPRAWTIMRETMESFDNHLQWSLEEADRRNLSFGDRLTFLREEGRKWVEDKRQNDPEMFAAWIQLNTYSMERGEADLVGLPSEFTMDDYNFYGNVSFSALV